MDRGGWGATVQGVTKSWTLSAEQQGPFGASPAAQTVNNPPGMQQIGVQSLGQEDPLEEGMATHSSILTWRIPWTEELGRLKSLRVAQSQT